MHVYSGTGNVFALVDERTDKLPPDPGAVVRALRTSTESTPAPDGLIQITFEDDAPRVAFFNPDGSRPEACGNGLRCAAFHLARTGGPCTLELQTDAGQRSARVFDDGAVEVSMGRATVGDVASLEGPHGSVEVVPVAIGNPHAVMFVRDPDEVDVTELGAWIGRHGRFPNGANVEFCSLDASGLRVRIWERGVGETRACGTGVCAAAAASRASGRTSLPCSVRTRGGVLLVRASEDELLLRGSVERLDRRSS